MFFHGEMKNYQFFWVDLFEAILSNFFTFIDQKSRMTQIDNFEYSFLYNLPIKIKSEKNMFLKIEFSEYSTIKDLSDHQSQEAEMTDDRL